MLLIVFILAGRKPEVDGIRGNESKRTSSHLFHNLSRRLIKAWETTLTPPVALVF